MSTICTATVADTLRVNLWDEENRLRAIDLNPSSPSGGGGGLHPIAIYTYDAGGERIIKQNATSVAIYENALQVGTTIKNDFMLYPSGMLVARPAADGTGALSYTKHYFAGSQRVSSKIGTTTNLGKFLQDWTLIENSSGGAPINLVSTSHDQLTVAEAGVNHVYTQFNMPTQTFASNTAFLPVPAFLTPPSGAGGLGLETEQYFFHPDHLGSSNYITNYVGDVSQHMEYFAFGESFVEEHKNSHNSPYKYNAKELDEESGLYYYGARYYDPRISIWLSTDPKKEKYPSISPYVYVANNPLNVIDPDGRDIIVLTHGKRDDDKSAKHIPGHQAVLIGNDKTGYTFYSYDSDKGSNGRKAPLDPKYGDNFTAGVTFKSLDEFKNSSYNTFKDDYDDGKDNATAHKDENGNIIQRFDNAFRITSDARTDELMKNAADGVFDSEYSLTEGNQCTAVPRAALQAGGFNDGEDNRAGNDHKIFSIENYFPISKHKSTVELNKGTVIDNQINRNDGKSTRRGQYPKADAKAREKYEAYGRRSWILKK